MPTEQKYRLEMFGPMWRLTHPSKRRVYLFDGASRLLSQILDEHGNSLSLFYGGELLSQVTDGLGRTLSFSYDGSGNMIMVGDGTRSVSYAYAGGLLTGVTDAAGHITTYAYAVPAAFPGLLASATEPTGNTPVTCAYDALGRVSTQTDALGNTSTYTYDAPSGNLYSDPLGPTAMIPTSSRS
jgi:YD repeat-containing protein